MCSVAHSFSHTQTNIIQLIIMNLNTHNTTTALNIASHYITFNLFIIISNLTVYFFKILHK